MIDVFRTAVNPLDPACYADPITQVNNFLAQNQIPDTDVINIVPTDGAGGLRMYYRTKDTA